MSSSMVEEDINATKLGTFIGFRNVTGVTLGLFNILRRIVECSLIFTFDLACHIYIVKANL